MKRDLFRVGTAGVCEVKSAKTKIELENLMRALTTCATHPIRKDDKEKEELSLLKSQGWQGLTEGSNVNFQ